MLIDGHRNGRTEGKPDPQGSKITVASSKFATRKSHLLPAKNVSSKKLLPRNSVMKVITLPVIRQNTIPYGQRHYQCL